MAQETTRRGVLAATALGAAALPLLASGCKGIGALGTPPRPLPDVAVARAAIAGEAGLIARYRAVLEALPALSGELRPLLAQHTEHLASLRGRLAIPGVAARPTPGGSGATGGPGGGGSASPAPAPSTPAAALASLRSAEDAASAALLRHLPAVSASFAQLLASIAASEATHGYVLRARRHSA